MTRTRILVVIGVAGLAVSAPCLGRIPPGGAQAQQPPAKTSEAAGHGHKPGAPAHDHDHPPIPAAYANAHIPTDVWTDPKMLAKGKEIFTAKCALCHGEKGDGKGPGSVNLPLKPGRPHRRPDGCGDAGELLGLAGQRGWSGRAVQVERLRDAGLEGRAVHATTGGR